MMYAYIPLKFIAPVHFGSTQEGGNLTIHHMTCSADTLFSALCHEAANMGSDVINELVLLVDSNQLRFSSLFPWYKGKEGKAKQALHLYLPKPLLSREREVSVKPFAEMKRIASTQKKMKHLGFVRSSKLKGFLSTNDLDVEAYAMPTIAVPLTMERVNCQGSKPLPYFVGAYQFASDAGLYFLVAFEDKSTLNFLITILEQLQYAGIGGKRSSGYGKFELGEVKVLATAGQNGSIDEDALFELANSGGAAHMAIAPFLPMATDSAVVKTGSYKLMKRAGFLATRAQLNTMKKDNIHMIKEGSCFTRPLEGTFLKQQIDGFPHPVYRYGKGFFLGVDYDE